jgi:hypothetical protein
LAEIVLLGAEEQAASSIALAYPERSFVFVTDCVAIDGGDLPNVRIIRGRPRTGPYGLGAGCETIALSPRWLERPSDTSLSVLFAKIESHFPGVALPVRMSAPSQGISILKGDLWHRPDHPVTGDRAQLVIADSGGGRSVYQDLLPNTKTVIAVGRRYDSGAVAMGLFRIFAERFFRIDVIQAAESRAIPELSKLTQAVISSLQWQGWFTLNWLLTAGGARLSSIRPIPRAVFNAFRRGRIDLMTPSTIDQLLPAGVRLIATPQYVEYR